MDRTWTKRAAGDYARTYAANHGAAQLLEVRRAGAGWIAKRDGEIVPGPGETFFRTMREAQEAAQEAARRADIWDGEPEPLEPSPAPVAPAPVEIERPAPAPVSRQVRRALERAARKRATRPGPFHGSAARSLSAAAAGDSSYADLSGLAPGDSVALLVSTMGRAWERKPLVLSRLPDRDGGAVYRVTSPGGTLDSGPLPADPLEPSAHRTLQAYVNATAGNWAWRIETRDSALRREYVGERRRDARRARSSGFSRPLVTDHAARALERARRTLETGGKGANPYGSGSAIWSGLGGSDGRTFSAYGESRLRWIERPEDRGLRFVGLAHDAAPANYAYSCPAVDHRGWYLDGEQFETVAGVVYQLPARDGRARYLAGYADPWNCDKAGRGPACLSLEIIESADCRGDESANMAALREAARAADGIAERFAEESREIAEARDAGRAAREAAAEALEHGRALVTACRDARDLWRLRHGLPALPAHMARAALRKTLETVRALRETYADARETARDMIADGPARPSRYKPGDRRHHVADSFWDAYAEGVDA